MKPWKIIKLIEVAEVQTGISKNKNRRLKNPIELPYLRVENVQDGFFNLKEVKTIHVEFEKVQRYSLKHGDVLLTEGGDFDKLGRGAVWREEVKNCLHQNHVFVVRPNKIRLLPDYLSLLISSNYGKRYFVNCSKQSTNLASINSSELKNFPVPLPDISTQLQMVEGCLLWDTAINKTDALIAAKTRQFEWLKSALFDKNFKGYKRKLSSYSGIMKHKKIDSVGGLKPLIVKLHCKGIEPNERGVQVTLSEKGRPYFQRSTNEFLISRQSFHAGGFGIVPANLDGFIASSIVTTLDIDESRLDVEYLFYFFSRRNYYMRIDSIMNGTGQKELSEKQIMNLPVSIPKLEKQKEVVQILNTAKKEIDLLNDIAKHYRTQKRGLMQKLLSGVWSIKSKETSHAPVPV